MKFQTFGKNNEFSFCSVRGVLVVLIIGLIFLITSCVVKQDVALHFDHSGSAEIDITLHQLFYEYIRDLTGSFSEDAFYGEDVPIFDTEEIKHSFSVYPELKLTSVEMPDVKSLSLSVQFKDIRQTLAQEEEVSKEFIILQKEGNVHTVKIIITQETLDELMSFSSLKDTMVAQMLLPPEDEPMTPEEYTEYLVWALEEYAATEVVRKAIEHASINIKIQVKGEITGVIGGKLSKKDTALFNVNVVKLLTRQTPLTLSLQYEK